MIRFFIALLFFFTFFFFTFFFFTFPFLRPALATEMANRAALHKAAFGILVHDRGPTSDRHESGIDANLEIQFNAPKWKQWQRIGSPYPLIGLTPNFKGHTSVFYGGLGYELTLISGFFVAGGASLALHNGPLHKEKVGCKERSDCGFGYRVLPRFSIELGTALLRNYGLSVFYDHMSHKWILPGENEGIDHVGVRYHYNFSYPRR